MRGTTGSALAALLISAAAVASDAKPIDAAIHLYDQGQYPEAVAALSSILDIGIPDPAQRTRARLYLGSAQLLMGQYAQARETVDKLLAEDPDAVADPANFPPDYVVLFKERRARRTIPPPPPPTVSAPAPEPEPLRTWGLYVTGVADPVHAVLGGEAGLNLETGGWGVGAGVTIAPHPGGRVFLARELARFSEAWSLSVTLRGIVTPLPSGLLAGGGVGGLFEWRVASHLSLLGEGAFELYGSPSGLLSAPLLSVGVRASL